MIKAWLRRLPGYPALRTAYHLLKGGEARNVALLRLRAPANLFQPYPTTRAERYPALFRQVRALVGDGPERRLLSFGCATGEELLSLRRHFPQAAIRGLDINPRNVATCRRRLRGLGDPGLSVALAGDARAEPAGHYDAVFAMAVFRHGELNVTPPPPRCDHRIRFETFQHTVAGLADCLKPGGLLVLWHAHFRFADTASARHFTELSRTQARQPAPVYGPDDALAGLTDICGGVYRKQA